MIQTGRGVHHFKCSVADTVQSFKTALIFDEKENSLPVDEGLKLKIDEDDYLDIGNGKRLNIM
jgi:hypothetical protein